MSDIEPEEIESWDDALYYLIHFLINPSSQKLRIKNSQISHLFFNTPTYGHKKDAKLLFSGKSVENEINNMIDSFVGKCELVFIKKAEAKHLENTEKLKMWEAVFSRELCIYNYLTLPEKEASNSIKGIYLLTRCLRILTELDDLNTFFGDDLGKHLNKTILDKLESDVKNKAIPQAFVLINSAIK